MEYQNQRGAKIEMSKVNIQGQFGDVCFITTFNCICLHTSFNTICFNLALFLNSNVNIDRDIKIQHSVITRKCLLLILMKFYKAYTSL